MVRLLFLFMLMPFLANSQSLKCKLIDEELSYKDSVKVEFKNEFRQNVYVSITLEKFINNKWIQYSRDVFTKPHSKQSVQIMLKESEAKTASFMIQEPELLEPNGKVVKGEIYKSGMFRMRINYGPTFDELNQQIITSVLKVHKP